MSDPREKFLFYFEGLLSSSEQRELALLLEADAELAAEYDEFVRSLKLAASVAGEKHQVPDGFCEKVLDAIEDIQPERSTSSMYKNKGIKETNSEQNNPMLWLAKIRYPAIACASLTACLLLASNLLKPKIEPASERVDSIAMVSQDEVSVKLATKTKVPAAGKESELAPNNLEVKAPDVGANSKPSTAPEVTPSLEPNPVPQILKESRTKKLKKQNFDQPVEHFEQSRHGLLSDVLESASQTSSYFDNQSDEMSDSFADKEMLSYDAGDDDYAYVAGPQSSQQLSENKFQTSTEKPVSTFSIDVDTASWSNIRRFLRSSSLPPVGSVRLEEMINYFSYDYPATKSKEKPLAVHTELGVAPWAAQHKLLKIGVKGFEIDQSEVPDSNLVFLIDVSGSMSSSDKLPLLKKSFGLLLEKLGTKDRISIVTYAGRSGVLLPSTSGGERGTILAAINSLGAGGSTAGANGIRTAYQIAKSQFIKGGNNRVILATDGDFNVGVSSNSELVALIEKERQSGVFLSVLGFGRGNLQDSKLEQLANKGNGNYSYIDSIREAKKVLVSDLRSTLYTIAKDVKIQIEFNPAYVQQYRLLGYENRMLASEDFNDDTKDAGEVGAGHTVTALYEIIPVGAKSIPPAVDDLRYQKKEKAKEPNDTSSPIEFKNELATVKLRYKLPDQSNSQIMQTRVNSDSEKSIQNMSTDFRFAAAVAEFGLILRNSAYKQNSSYKSVLAAAKSNLGKDKTGYRREFVELVETAELLSK